MNKKGFEISLRLVVFAVLILIVLIVMVGFIQTAFSPLGIKISKESVRIKQEECKLEGLRNPDLLENDNDEYPNQCDICPWYDSSKDLDGDFMPDGCDKDKNNPSIFECAYGMNERGQCKREAVEEKKEPVEEEEKAQTEEEKVFGWLENFKESSKNADEQLSKSQELFDQKEYDNSYVLLVDMYKTYKKKEISLDAENLFNQFEVVYYDNDSKLLQFYKDAIELEIHPIDYKNKMDARFG